MKNIGGAGEGKRRASIPVMHLSSSSKEWSLVVSCLLPPLPPPFFFSLHPDNRKALKAEQPYSVFIPSVLARLQCHSNGCWTPALLAAAVLHGAGHMSLLLACCGLTCGTVHLHSTNPCSVFCWVSVLKWHLEQSSEHWSWCKVIGKIRAGIV